MPIRRSGSLRLALATMVLAMVLLAPFSAVVAQSDYPIRPIRIVVPSGPGSAPDLIPRLLGEAPTARVGPAGGHRA